MARRRTNKDTTLLSFLDTLSNGVGAAILLLLVFGSAGLAQSGVREAPPSDLIVVELHTEQANAALWARVTRPRTRRGRSPDYVPLQGPARASAAPSTAASVLAFPGPRNSIVLQLPVQPEECASIAFGYVDHQRLTTFGRLERLPIRATWGAGERCCVQTSPTYDGTALQLRVSAGGQIERCDDRPAPFACACSSDM